MVADFSARANARDADRAHHPTGTRDEARDARGLLSVSQGRQTAPESGPATAWECKPT